MTTRTIISCICTVAALTLTTGQATAQDLVLTQFDATPLSTNPAFTGMFNGGLRANLMYRNQWTPIDLPYVIAAASVDMPVHIWHSGSYLAAGLQVSHRNAGDGNTTSSAALVSLAYHQFFGSTAADKPAGHSSDLAIGVQLGYGEKTVPLYFYHIPVTYFNVNAGASFSRAISTAFSYTLGVAASNITLPGDAPSRKENDQYGIDMRYTAQLGASYAVTPRFTLRPAAQFYLRSAMLTATAGNEFNYAIGKKGKSTAFSTALFAGLWYRSGDAVMGTAGIEYKRLRAGATFDYRRLEHDAAEISNSAFELTIRYIAPLRGLVSRTAPVPSARF